MAASYGLALRRSSVDEFVAHTDLTKDWVVVVDVLEGRNLMPTTIRKKSPKDAICSPVVEVDILGKTRVTRIYEDCVNSRWDEVFVFVFGKDDGDWDVLSGSCSFRVLDANAKERGATIGSHTMVLRQVFEHQGHEVRGAWVALDAPTQGPMLRLSVRLYPPGQPVKWQSNARQAGKIEKLGVARPLHVPEEAIIEECTLSIKCYRAEGLPRTDKVGQCDPYVAVKFEGRTARTRTCNNTLNPEWSEELQLPVSLPTLSDAVELQVFDDDKMRFDEHVCSAWFSLSDVLTVNSIGPLWVPLYGAYSVSSNSASKQMNRGFKEGMAPRGRILVGVSLEKPAVKEVTVHKVSPCRPPPVAPQGLRFGLCQVSNLQLAAQADVFVEVVMGALRVTSRVLPSRDGAASWYEELPQLANHDMPVDERSIPDVFVYIYAKGLPHTTLLGYLRLKTANFRLSQKAQWMQVVPTTDKIPETPPSILFRMHYGQLQDLNRTPTTNFMAVPDLKTWELRVRLHRARMLAPNERTGTADPFVTVTHGRHSARSATIARTLDPEWNETLSLRVGLPNNVELATDIVVYVKDETCTQEEVIGYFVVAPSKIKFGRGFAEAPAPVWHDLRSKMCSVSPGQVLASFMLIDPTEAMSVHQPVFKSPTYMEYVMEVSLLGFKDLLAADLSVIECPSAIFKLSCQNFDYPSRSSSYPNGPNAVVGQVIKTKFSAPTDPSLAPMLILYVFDNRKAGVAPVGIGHVSLQKLFEEMQPRIPGPTTHSGSQEMLRTASMSSTAGSLASAPDVGRKGSKSAKSTGALPTSPISRAASTSRASSGGSDLYTPLQPNLERASIPAGVRRLPSQRKSRGLLGIPEQSRGSTTSSLAGKHHAPTAELPVMPSRLSIVAGSLDASVRRQSLVDFKGKTKPKKKDGHFEMREIHESIPENELWFDDEDLRCEGEWTEEVERECYFEIDVVRGCMRGGRTLTHAAATNATLANSIATSSADKLFTTTMLFNELVEIPDWRQTKCGRVGIRARICQAPQWNDKLATSESVYIQTPCFVRIHVIRACDLVPRRGCTTVNSYIAYRLSGTENWTRERKVVRGTCSPSIFQSFELRASVPGNSVDVAVFDASDVPSQQDELIGFTRINLERYWTSHKWKQMGRKPVEVRPLLCPTNSHNQGSLEVCTEIVHVEDKRPFKPVVAPRLRRYELRVVIWEAEGLLFNDVDNTADIYAATTFDEMKKNSDTHFRARNGRGSFNYRMCFPIRIPMANPNLQLKIHKLWARDDGDDTLPADRYLGEVKISLRNMFNHALMTGNCVLMDREWVNLDHRSRTHPSQSFGRVLVSFEAVSEDYARQFKVDEGNTGLPGRDRDTDRELELSHLIKRSRYWCLCCFILQPLCCCLCLFLFLGILVFIWETDLFGEDTAIISWGKNHYEELKKLVNLA